MTTQGRIFIQNTHILEQATIILKQATKILFTSHDTFKRSLGCDVVSYVGIAFDEQSRCKPGFEYPLVRAQMTEKQALQFCYSQGVDFGGVYRYFHRASCFCCPLGGKQHFRRLFRYNRRLFDFVGVLDFIDV